MNGAYKMNKIEIKILNPEAITSSERMMVCAARLTQRGESITNMNDFMELYNRGASDVLKESLINLPHPTLQKFGVINIVIVGASRRFLAQITRHQNEVKFMSASLQYSNYSGKSQFTVPYSILKKGKEAVWDYQARCFAAMENYQKLMDEGESNDTAGYVAPQGLRNVLIISATPFQWKHIINQRTCNRNTEETQYVMLRVWEELYQQNPILFSNCGPSCSLDGCKEQKMKCGDPFLIFDRNPSSFISAKFPYLVNGE